MGTGVVACRPEVVLFWRFWNSSCSKSIWFRKLKFGVRWFLYKPNILRNFHKNLRVRFRSVLK